MAINYEKLNIKILISNIISKTEFIRTNYDADCIFCK